MSVIGFGIFMFLIYFLTSSLFPGEKSKKSERNNNYRNNENWIEKDKNIQIDEIDVENYQYIGNVAARIYHKRECKNFRNKKIVGFTSRVDAESKGYAKCKKCMPPIGENSKKEIIYNDRLQDSLKLKKNFADDIVNSLDDYCAYINNYINSDTNIAFQIMTPFENENRAEEDIEGLKKIVNKYLETRTSQIYVQIEHVLLNLSLRYVQLGDDTIIKLQDKLLASLRAYPETCEPSSARSACGDPS